MKMIKKIVLAIGMLALALPLWAADTRTAPLTANIIIEDSDDLAKAGQAPMDWLCGHVLGELLIPGDTLNVWLAGAASKPVYQGTIKDEAAKADIEKQIRAVAPAGQTVDFAGALKAAAAEKGGAMVYTLIICGSANPAQTPETAGMLRYSRVEGFSAWRAIQADLNARGKVREAAAAYMAAVR